MGTRLRGVRVLDTLGIPFSSRRIVLWFLTGLLLRTGSLDGVDVCRGGGRGPSGANADAAAWAWRAGPVPLQAPIPSFLHQIVRSSTDGFDLDHHERSGC